MKTILFSPGEPAGIGPDLIIKLVNSRIWESIDSKIVCLGDSEFFLKRSNLLEQKIKIHEVESLNKLKKNKKGILQVFKVKSCEDISPCKPNPINAKYILDHLDFGIKYCKAYEKTALVTGPIQKSNIIDAGYNFTGHTEWIKKKTGSSDVLMMLASEKLRVALTTTHLPLKEVYKEIKKSRVLKKIMILDSSLKSQLKIKKPYITVLGLNPHAGESGHLGTEEIKYIQPAIKEAKKKGINVNGPLAADTAFNKETLKLTDAYLSMYHDQGLPVLKALSFGDAVNITLGTPIIRTSVDHGTALELAGTNNVSTKSLVVALKQADQML